MVTAFNEMREIHPYQEFIPTHPKSMIVGSFPIGKFTDPHRRKEIKPHEIDFFFGGEKNLLWRLLGECFGRKLSKVEDIKEMLESEGMAIGDVIKSCRRHEGKAADANLYDVEWNYSLIEKIRFHRITKVFFTSRQVQKWFERLFPETKDLEQVQLISPSAQSARSLGKMESYIQWKKENPQLQSYDFILSEYLKIFQMKKS
jgi:G:T/U-mismatch repair DNA glycosylase